MKQEYARVSVVIPENEKKEALLYKPTYEVENNVINDKYTVKL